MEPSAGRPLTYNASTRWGLPPMVGSVEYPEATDDQHSLAPVIIHADELLSSRNHSYQRADHPPRAARLNQHDCQGFFWTFVPRTTRRSERSPQLADDAGELFPLYQPVMTGHVGLEQVGCGDIEALVSRFQLPTYHEGQWLWSGPSGLEPIPKPGSISVSCALR